MDFLNLKLYSICFLDALSIGFLVPILSSHVTSLGGTHTILGILGTCHATFQLISGPLIRTWKDILGLKTVLFVTLLINLFTYISLGITSSYVIAILIRIVFATTNQTQTLCKAFISTYNDQEKLDSIYSLMDALTTSGLVVGPVVGGILFEYESGFFYISVLCSLLLSLCLIISWYLPSTAISEKDVDKTTFLEKLKEGLSYSINKIRGANLSQQWDVLVLRCLFHMSVTVFFIKFSLLLKTHYQATPTIVGYTYAYHSILMFLSVIISLVLHKLPENATNFVSLLFINTFGLFGLCFAPTYGTYLACFLPAIIAQTLLNKQWKELFTERSVKDHNIEGLDVVLGKIIAVVIPVIFGIFCDIYGHYAIQAFVIVPQLFAIAIAIFYNSVGPVADVPVVEKKDE